MPLFGSNELPEGAESSLPEEEMELVDRLAKKVVEKGWTVVAILFLESVKPLNFIGSQALVFFEPIVQTVFNFKDYNILRTALEKRDSIEILLLKIEEYDAVDLIREKRIKKFMKQEKKSWKWYQRYLGVFQPKVEIPDEVLNPPAPTKKPDGWNSSDDSAPVS